MLAACLVQVALAAESATTAVSPDSVALVKAHDELRKKAGSNDEMRSLCSGLKKCLDMDYPGCFEEDKKPWPKVKYDDAFCGEYREVVKRGFAPDLKSPMALEIFARLGRQYRVVYAYEGTLPVEENVMSYLFDNMPFTAQLINAYLESEYVLEYASPDRRYFNGSNGRSLSGEFYWALQDSAGQRLGMRNLFFGYGHAKILRWALHGTAIAYLDMDPLPGKKGVKYKLTAIVFPANTVLNSIMQMDVFRKVVNEKISHIVDDIKKSSGRYFAGDKEPMLKSANLKSSENIQYILDFEAVVGGAPWKLGDFVKLKKMREEQRKKALDATPLRVEEFQKVKDAK